MAEVKRWSGNTTSQISLYDDELIKLSEFIKSHKSVYIYGKGKIGKALNHYLIEAETPVKGYITSEDIDFVSREYKEAKMGIILGVGDKNLEEILPGLKKIVNENDIFILSSLKRESIGNVFSLKSTEENFWINIFVTNKCNLNCRSCSSFAPICTPDFYDIELFKKDLIRLKEIEFTNISVLKFTGGEPFLHPDLFEMFEFTRKNFPNINIECYTNGLFLEKLDDEKLEKLKEMKITLVITEYPLKNLDLRKEYIRADKIGIMYCVIYSEDQKYFSKRPLNLKKDTPKSLFYYCPRYKMCDSLFMFNSKLYKCIYGLTHEYFNDSFGTNLELLEKDYLNLYVVNKEQVYNYCISRIPYCGYCSPIEELVPWGISEKKIEEWT